MKHILIFLAVFFPLFLILTQGGKYNHGTPAFIVMLTISYFISKYILKTLENRRIEVVEFQKNNPSNGTPPSLTKSSSEEFKKCCHCAEKIRIEAEVCRYCGLDPDQETMKTQGITFDGEKYKFLDHHFSKRSDAIKYAKIKTKRSQ